jgi:predicted negative regulator of RcsB-dependent stress response
MATSHYKINVKDLKQPDEFVTTVDRIGNYLANNLMRVIIGTAIAIVLGAIIFTYFFYRSHMVRATADHFYDALVALNHKDYKTAEDGFDSVAHTGSGKLAHLASLYAATAYMGDHKPAEARDKLEAFIANSDNHLFKNLAMVQLGVAYEDLGDYKKAHDTYVKAVAIPGPAKTDAQLGAARTLLKQGDKAGAIAAWRKFLVENPFSNERMGIIDTLAHLGVAPTDSPSPITPSTTTSAAPAASAH